MKFYIVLGTFTLPFALRFLASSATARPSTLQKQIYNKVARTLVAFEYLWYQAWVQSIEQAKAGLQVIAALLANRQDGVGTGGHYG